MIYCWLFFVFMQLFFKSIFKNKWKKQTTYSPKILYFQNKFLKNRGTEQGKCYIGIILRVTTLLLDDLILHKAPLASFDHRLRTISCHLWFIIHKLGNGGEIGFFSNQATKIHGKWRDENWILTTSAVNGPFPNHA